MDNNYLYIAYINYIDILEKIESGDPNDIKLQIIGYYDIKTKIWYSGWSFYTTYNFDQYKKSKELLNYAIDIDIHLPSINDKIKMIIKYILTSSKIYIYEEDIQLDLILAIIIYFSKAKKIYKFNTNNINRYNILI